MAPDDDDEITQADVADGFLHFYAGFKAGKNHELRSQSEHIISKLGQFESQIVDILMPALAALEMEYYADPKWAGGDGPDIDPDEAVFLEWRKSHPRDLSSPRWGGVLS